MKSMERRPGEGRMEYLARLATIKSIGFAALAAAGAVLVPPAAVLLVPAAAIESVQAGVFHVAQQRLKDKHAGKRH